MDSSSPTLFPDIHKNTMFSPDEESVTSDGGSPTTEGRKSLSGMEKYENLGPVGEGSYGMVLKCRHKETQQVVAVKKFFESEDDKMVRKIAMREVRMLKQLRHENLVNLIEVFRKKKKLYLVFEFVDHTVLDELDKCPHGLDEHFTRKIIWQVLRGIQFCHSNNIIHRDIKPENILVSKSGVVKLCDFGFARIMAQPGETYTDYVATRWYRGPELLVGDTKYGKAVDIWAVGCLVAELLTSEPLFPGESDLDQLYKIIKCLGNLTPRYKEIFHKNPMFSGTKLPEVRSVDSFEKRFPPKCSMDVLDVMKKMLELDADARPSCPEILKHPFFTHNQFDELFLQEIKAIIQSENERKPLNNLISKNGTEESANKRKSKAEISYTPKDENKQLHKKPSPVQLDSKTNKSMPAINQHMPLINGASPTGTGKSKSKLGKPSTRSIQGLELSLKTEKTQLHEKLTQVSADKKYHYEDKKDGGIGNVSLPELRKNPEVTKTGNGQAGKKSINQSPFNTPRLISIDKNTLPSV